MGKLLIGWAVAAVLALASSLPAAAQGRDKGARAAPAAGTEVRYFIALGDLLGDELPVDAFLKETRQGGKVVSAVLDVCYSVSASSDRKDRFAVELKPDGDRLTGSGESFETRTPVTVNLTRKAAGKAVRFDGKITVGSHASLVSSTDNTDVDEKEFQQSQVIDEDLVEAPADFTQVSPQAISIRVRREGFTELLRSLRGERVQVALDSIAVDCPALRTGQQTLRLIVDPLRAPGLLAKFKTAPGVLAVGWAGGNYDMERAVRVPAAEWSEAGKPNRDRLAKAIAAAAAKSFAAKTAATTWNDTTGELAVALKRPSPLAPGLDLTETIEFTALVGPDRPGASDHLVIWLGEPTSRVSDEASGPHLEFTNAASDEESGFGEDDGVIRALAAEIRGQRWDTTRSAWK